MSLMVICFIKVSCIVLLMRCSLWFVVVKAALSFFVLFGMGIRSEGRVIEWSV